MDYFLVLSYISSRRDLVTAPASDGRAVDVEFLVVKAEDISRVVILQARPYVKEVKK